MKLNSIKIQNMRNITNAGFVADKQLNVIAGQNAQGKTNILECIWLLTGSKSFRGAKDNEMVQQNESFGKVFADVEGKSQLQIEVSTFAKQSGRRGRSAKINGVAYAPAAEIAGNFTAVVFDPGHLALIKAGPEGRRKFLDAALCQLYPGLLATIRRYLRALSQKNALLKKYAQTTNAEEMLDVFDAELAFCGGEILKKRRQYLALLSPLAQTLYSEISSGKEQLYIKYTPCCECEEMLLLFKNSRRADIQAGFCTKGPHREDFETSINGKNAKTFGSQGQQRSVALSLKLAEAACTKQLLGQHPVMLLDDVLSELDESRQSYLLSKISGKQTFVSSCNTLAFGRTAGKIIKVENGEIFEQ